MKQNITNERAMEILNLKYRKNSVVPIEDEQEACRIGMNAINELAALKAKIESGTLIELPCRIGDTVYAVHYNQAADYGEIKAVTCTGFSVDADKIRAKSSVTAFPISLAGTYLTKSEAKRRLKELGGNK